MADQHHDNIPAVANTIIQDIVKIKETLGFHKDAFEQIGSGWSDTVYTGYNVKFLQAGTNATSRTMQNKARDIVHAADFDTFANAVADLDDAGGGRLVVSNGTFEVDDDLTVPATIELDIQKGGLVEVASGMTLTIMGKLTSGAYQIFSGDGDVEFYATSPGTQYTVHQIHPAWWGAFPNFVDDTEILNKAIAAATNICHPDYNYVGDPEIIIGAGYYKIEPGALNKIPCSFIAPDAYFIPTEEVDASLHILSFGYAVGGLQKRVKIGGVYGLTAYNEDPADHYHTAILFDEGDGGIFEIGNIVGCYVGLKLDGRTTQSHIGVNRFTVKTIAGCNIGIYLSPGVEDDGDLSAQANEANVFDVEYMTHCGVAVALHTETGDAVCFSNSIRINVLELHGRPEYNIQGFQLAGPRTLSNTFEVTGALTAPGSAGSFILTTDDSAAENIFKLCAVDWSYIYQSSTAGYNIFDFAGRSNTVYPGTYTNPYARSNIVNSAAPSSGVWRVGDKCWNSAPAAGGTMGWVCTTAGNPGTWKAFGTIAS